MLNTFESTQRSVLIERASFYIKERQCPNRDRGGDSLKILSAVRSAAVSRNHSAVDISSPYLLIKAFLLIKILRLQCRILVRTGDSTKLSELSICGATLASFNDPLISPALKLSKQASSFSPSRLLLTARLKNEKWAPQFSSAAARTIIRNSYSSVIRYARRDRLEEWDKIFVNLCNFIGTLCDNRIVYKEHIMYV